MNRYAGRVALVGLAAFCAATVPASATSSGLAAAPVPTTRSLGTVAATYVQYTTTDTWFVLTGTLTLGDQQRRGEFRIAYSGSASDATLYLGYYAQVLGHCSSTDTLSLGTPGGALLRCTGRFDGGTTGTTTLVVALPVARDGAFSHGSGYEYEGQYAG